jgi:hypothetical protein
MDSRQAYDERCSYGTVPASLEKLRPYDDGESREPRASVFSVAPFRANSKAFIILLLFAVLTGADSIEFAYGLACVSRHLSLHLHIGPEIAAWRQ